MSIRGHVQRKHAEYGKSNISHWISHAAYEYLKNDAGLYICTPNNFGEDDNSWEICFNDIEEVKRAAKHLHEHPDAIDKYFDDDEYNELIGENRGEELASLLDEGIEVAEKNGYFTINIDWY